MRRSVLLLALLFLGCHRELPTEPLHEKSIGTNDFQLPMIRVEPDPVVVPAGGGMNVTAKLTQDAFTYPTAVPIYSGNPNIAVVVNGSIPKGQKSAPMGVQGVAQGECDIYYQLTNFPGLGHSAVAAHVIVTASLKPPPYVPPVKDVTMEPNPVELKTGQETTVRVTAANSTASEVTFKAETGNVVQITGKVAAGRGVATLTIRAIGAGKTNILFVAGEKSGIAGRALVEDPPPSRRRASRS